MKLREIFFSCMATALLLACGTDDDGGSQTAYVTLADSVKTEQVLYADETTGGGITFTADAAWTATVTDASAARSTGGSSVEWLTLSQYSGDAGMYTLTMTLTENLTGSDRKAKIIIQCGSTTITIIVEQKATTEDGTTVKRIKEIVCEETMNSNLYGRSGEGVSHDNFVRTFAYDEQGRVARVVTTYPNHTDSWEPSSVTATYDYSIVGEIAIRIAEVYSYSEDVSEYRAILNEQGNVSMLQEKEDGVYSDYIQFSYTAYGYLTQIKDRNGYDGDYRGEENFSYTDGYFTKYTYKYDNSEPTVFDFSDSYTHSYKNNGQLDFMAYLYEDGDFDFLFHIGRLGRLGKYMPEKIFTDYGDYCEREPEYNEPNVTIHETHSYVDYSSTSYASVSYAFDSDDNLTTIKTVEPFKGTTIEYDVVVGSELVDSDCPYYGYKYTIENRTETTKDDTNTRVFTIKY